MKNLLILIDMQNDFCMPDGALYIPGSGEDVKRVTDFMAREGEKIDHIVLTQDNHQVLDIAHPGFWRNATGKMPPVFSNITLQDVKEGKWLPLFHQEQVMEYLRKLEEQGEYTHTIWPEHCLMGSVGAAFVPALSVALVDWARQGKYYDVVIKGTHPLTEHFGAFRANIPIEGAPETQLNVPLIEKIRTFDRIIIAGEAKSHCVANSIKQLFPFPEIVRKLLILEDGMADVPGFGHLAVPVYEEAKHMGAQMTLAGDLIL